MDHPLNGTYAYFDSWLEINVTGEHTFEGQYSIEYGQTSWPVIGGTVNLAGPEGSKEYALGFLLRGPKDAPVLPNFIDAWVGWAMPNRYGKIDNLQLRYTNTTYHPHSQNWTKFSWLPNFEDYGARSYIRIK